VGKRGSRPWLQTPTKEAEAAEEEGDVTGYDEEEPAMGRGCCGCMEMGKCLTEVEWRDSEEEVKVCCGSPERISEVVQAERDLQGCAVLGKEVADGARPWAGEGGAWP